MSECYINIKFGTCCGKKMTIIEKTISENGAKYKMWKCEDCGAEHGNLIDIIKATEADKK